MKSLKLDHVAFLSRILVGILVVSWSAIIYAADVFDTEAELPRRDGYLVVDMIIGRPTTNWRLSNNLKLENLPLGKSTRLIRLPAGEYRWEQIELPYFNLPHRVDLTDDNRWSFTIEQQKINYVGTLIIHESRGSDTVGVQFVNRTSSVVGRLKEKFPDHMAAYGIIFAGNYRDDYLSLSEIDKPNAQVE